MRRRTLVFAALFALSIFLGRLTVLPETGLAVFWPAAGVGVLWLLRTRSRPEVVLAAALVGVLAATGNAITGLPVLAGVILGVANVTVCVVTRALFIATRTARSSPLADGLRRMSGFYRFVGAAAVGVAASAVVGVAAIATTGADVGWGTGIGWWLRNMTAVLVIAGPLVTMGNRPEPGSRRQLAEAAVVFAASVAAMVWTFGPDQDLPLAFLPLGLVVWGALRLPLPSAAAQGGLIAVSALVLVRTFEGGPLGVIESATDRALVLQAFMMISAMLAMVLATVRTQVEDVMAGLAAARRRAVDAVEDLRILVEALPVGLFLIGRDGSIELQNGAASSWLPGPVEGDDTRDADGLLLSRTLDGRDLPPQDRPSVRALRGERVEGQRLVSEDAAGERRVVSVDALPLHAGEDGAPAGAVLMWQDVTEDHETVERLRRERARSDRLIADAPHGIVVLDADGRISQANRALATMFGRTMDDLVGTHVSALAPDSPAEVADYLRQAVAADGRLVEAEWQVPGADGELIHVATSSRFITDGADDEEIIVNVVDVSERRRYEDRLTHLADHDALTGLPNRRRFEADMVQHQALCARYGPRGALLLIDLDHFKEVNDTLGHAAGDHLIASTGRILRDGVRTSDTVARLGGDEFAVLLPEADETDAETVAAHLVRQIREHCAALDGAHRRVTASIGVVTFDAATAHDGDVLALADMLMYDAKDAGRDGYVLLTSAEHRHPRLGARMEWRDRIEHALHHDLFELHLQPILDVARDEVTRAEALVRLRDGDELVSPGKFVYIAELTGLAPALDSWVLRRSIALLAELREHDPGFTLEVNVSAYSIGDPGVERALVDALAEFGVDASALVVEVTETAAVRDVAAAKGFGERLRALGVHFALDDFGAGYGSFYYLKHLVFDYVKIDGEFVTDAARSPMDRQLLRSIVDVARNLGKGTIAEFISDTEVFELVRELGVDYAQGYYVGRPTPVASFVSSYLHPRPAVGAARVGVDRV
ncbi:EAL domain-containing protein [uncultured Phycicoccus sp.]|uniref:bifunctional diguanylate cyclase/phosphodiesterase n=1 Tax=uncultured Phycicoccus sp. TaxID=661422 RepID=UPI0026018124|nr:EAL domain-containing protein [uncultured Phycicoccus sp.]